MGDEQAIQNNTRQALPARQEKAASLVAADDLTDEQIAAEVGVTRDTLSRWKRQLGFVAAVADHRQRQRAAIEAKGIADKQNRIRYLNERHAALRQIVKERGEDEAIAHLPGASTGYVVRTFRTIGVGPLAQTVEEHAVDTGLLREFRAHEQQAAQELGEWVEKVAPTKGDGSDLSLADLLQKARALKDAGGDVGAED